MFEDTFGRRRGYIPAPVPGERETLSPGARRRLLNIFHRDFYQVHLRQELYTTDLEISPVGGKFFLEVWTELLGKRLDQYPGYTIVLHQINEFFERGVWHFPFDIWEGIFKFPHSLLGSEREKIAAAIRRALEIENTAYTFVGGRFIERMTETEVQSVEKVLRSPIEGIREHFATALRMLSDRENPDHRNSVKESISAVEAACKHLTGLQNATLGEALNHLDGKRPLHSTFKNALHKLYGWTNQEDGIRHAIIESDKIERADAQFMLVTCSAFVNYLFER